MDSSRFAKYKKFFNKKCSTLCESKTWHASKYMDFSREYESKRRCNGYCLNFHNSTFNLLRKNENQQAYLYEATGIVQPYQRLRESFDNFCKEHIDQRFLALSEKDFGLSNSTIPLVDDVEKMFRDPDEKYEIYNLVTFRFAAPAEVDLKELLHKFIDKAENDGYGMSKFGRETTLSIKQPIDGEILDLYFVSFEAKFNSFRVNLARSLYHFTSIECLSKIDKDGLTPQSANPEFTYEKRVYLFNNIPIDEILSFAQDRAQLSKWSKFALLRVDTAKLTSWKDYVDGKVLFYADTKIVSLDLENVEAIYTYEAVPRSFIDDDVIVFELDKHFRPINKIKAKLSQF